MKNDRPPMIRTPEAIRESLDSSTRIIGDLAINSQRDTSERIISRKLSDGLFGIAPIEHKEADSEPMSSSPEAPLL